MARVPAGGLILPPGVKGVRGRDLWPTPDVLKLASGALLKHHGEWMPMPIGEAKVYRGPHDLTVLVSLDDRGDAWGPLLHMSLSLPRGYPDWDTIYAVTRAVFGEQVDAMMPIPREEAFIHHAVKGQRHVFHVTEMPEAWPAEGHV
jgi:hypothetical protein